MHTITFFATKGGSGRTVSTMALASGFLALGNRVMVMDCTDQAGTDTKGKRPSTLQNWQRQMAACSIRPPQLELVECWTREQVEDNLASAAARGVDVALIDTPAAPLEPQLQALGCADLIIAPANGPFEAKCTAAGITEYLTEPENILGLIMGCRDGAAEAAETREAFGYYPVFQSELPWAEALADQILHGDIAHLVSQLTCKPDRPGYARYREAQAAWAAVLQLTFEAQWALQGKRLHTQSLEQSPFAFNRKAAA